MFEKEISNYAFNLARGYTGDHVPLSSLLINVELPDGFKKFAEAEVEEMMDEDGLSESKTGRFNRADPQVLALFKEIRHVLKSSFEFSREEFLDLAEKASKFIFNYVIRPRWTLEKFLFKGETEIDKSNLEKSARFFNDYSYYLRGIIEYLEFHKKNKLDVETWKKLHTKIDEQLLDMIPTVDSIPASRDSENATRWTSLESLINPLFELFQFASGNGTVVKGEAALAGKVPTDAMILFFKDKAATDIMDRLEFAREVKNIQFLDMVSLKIILQAESKESSVKVEVLPLIEEPPKEFKKYELPPEKPHEEDGKKSEMGEGDAAAEQLRSRVMEQENSDVKVPGSFHSEKEKQLDQQLLFEPVEAKERNEKTLSVRSLLTAKYESKIIKKIFGGSKSAYHIAVHKLDESPDWKGASRMVEGIFIDNNVDPFSKYAVIFTEAVSKKFSR